MATEPKVDPSAPALPAAPTKGRIASLISRFITNRGGTEVERLPVRATQKPITDDDWNEWIADPVSYSALGGTEARPVRSRQQVYRKWQDMLADPIISSAMRLHVMAALGGHEAKGEMVFIEPTVDAKADKAMEKLVKSLAEDLQPLFNRLAPTVAFNGVGFGDAYGRIYGRPGLGVVDVYSDELVYPPLVQPYEHANTTVGFTVSTGSKFIERLSILQIARMKMPRTMYVPQDRVIEKAIRVALTTDNIEELPAVPALAGGSFLDGAEVAYEKFAAAWSGLVGQRVRDSVDETLISVTQTGMTPAQRKKFKDSLVRMFERSNAYINEVVKGGRAVFGRVRHFIPTSTDKQLTEIRGPAGQGAGPPLTIEDVMMHARLLAGALGTDLSMVGFADQLSGGLGDGGFFRVSAQSAERARSIRAALTEFFDHIISVHLLYKHGIDLTGKKKPWDITYYSGISALESERAKTKADNMNSSALLVQTLAQLKDLGLPKEAIQHLLETEMGLDADAAEKYADGLDKAIKDAKAAAAAEGGFGGGGGGGLGGVGPLDPEPGTPKPPGGGEDEGGAPPFGGG